MAMRHELLVPTAPVRARSTIDEAAEIKIIVRRETRRRALRAQGQTTAANNSEIQDHPCPAAVVAHASTGGGVSRADLSRAAEVAAEAGRVVHTVDFQLMGPLTLALLKQPNGPNR